MQATLELQPPDNDVAAKEFAEAAREIHALLDKGTPGRVSIQASDDSLLPEIFVPTQALALLGEVFSQLAIGNAVTIVPVHAELTTQQAAEILNVSRPYVVQLLESRQLPYRKVGTRRRIRFSDLMDFRARDEQRRREVLSELTAEAEELGLGY